MENWFEGGKRAKKEVGLMGGVKTKPVSDKQFCELSDPYWLRNTSLMSSMCGKILSSNVWSVFTWRVISDLGLSKQLFATWLNAGIGSFNMGLNEVGFVLQFQ